MHSDSIPLDPRRGHKAPPPILLGLGKRGRRAASSDGAMSPRPSKPKANPRDLVEHLSGVVSDELPLAPDVVAPKGGQ
jgi:hypothetical protein